MAASLIAGIRFVRVASMCESGWSLVIAQWQDATFGIFGLGHTGIGHRAPSRQADFWLGEVDRVLQDDPESASLRMGAAWVLDSPGFGFLKNHFKQSDFAPTIPQLGLELDDAAISAEKAAFREKCVDKCLEMAERATDFDPTDVRWWRLRALLLFEGDSLYSGEEFEPRARHWLEILDACKAHDPNNALYDYLAALQLWNTSASYDLPVESNDISVKDEVSHIPAQDADKDPDDDEDYWILSVHEPNEFDLGVKCFARAQQLPFLAIGEAGYPSIAEFLTSSRLCKADQAEIALSRLITFRHSTLFIQLWRWQSARADEAQQEGNLDKAMSILRQSLRLCDQAANPKETTALNTLTTFSVLRRSTYDGLQKLAEDHPTLIESSELALIQQREEGWRVDALTLQYALQNLDDENNPSEFAAWPAVVSTVTCVSAAILLVAAIASVLVAMLFSSRSDSGERLGILRLAIAWFTGCGVTFVVLGLAPAEVISHEAQRKAAVTGVWLAAAMFVAAALFLVIRLLRRRKFRFRLITLLATMTGVAVLASLWPLMAATFDAIARNPPELWLDAKGWDGVDAEVLRLAMTLKTGSLDWAMIQWFAHGGLYVGLVASLLIAALWFMRRSAKRAARGFIGYWTQDIRVHWSSLLFFVGRTCLVAGLCFVFLYVCVAPEAMQLSEAEFQHQMRYCRNPEGVCSEIRDAQAAVRNSPKTIKAIRERVYFGMFGDGVLEQDFSGE